MRLIMTAAIVLAQSAPLPPAYPRPGTTKLFENARVIVWNISWLKQQYALHRHPYDLIGVYYTSGDRMIVSADGARRPVSTKAWETAFQNAGVTHIEEGASDRPLKAVFVEMKEPAPSLLVDMASSPAPFPQGGGTRLRENERATAWEVDPQHTVLHRHVRDAVAVAFDGETPRVAFIPKGTVHTEEFPGPADRLYVFELK